ncbi:MAG: twin-arginine translocation signal domain-containing protein, partial [Acidobacteriota bacterium]
MTKRIARRDFLKGTTAATLAVTGATSQISAQPQDASGNPDSFVRSQMPLRVRRVVTGHNGNGRAVVTIDEAVQKITSARAGHSDALIWQSAVPADNTDATDGALRPAP